MQTQIKARHKNTFWSKLCQCLGLLLFSLILTACGQSSAPQQGVIADDKLSVPFPKAITALLIDGTSLIVHVVVNGDTDNPVLVENPVVDTTEDTFSGNVPGFPTGTYTLLLVYSIDDLDQGTVEVVRTSEITVDVVAGEDTPADFSAADITYTDTDGDSISNLKELDDGTDINTPNYAVGGQVEGLEGSGLVLQNNGSDNLTISADDTFSFSPAMIDGSEYAVSVLTQPGNPNQICTVNNGSDIVKGDAVSNITVTCLTTSYTVGGTVSGYTGSGLILQNNDGDDLPVSTNGAFSFSSSLADGSEYTVSVLTSPDQVCAVNNGSGTLSGAAVSDVAIICSADSYTVGGTVSGYTGSGLILQNNGSDDLTINNAEEDFTFGSAVANGGNYNVTVLTQPDNLNQMCTVSNGSGTVSDAPISNVSVICNTNAAPTATGVTIINVNGGNTAVGNSLSGSYTYSDADSDPEGKSTFRWLADDVAITDATTTSYTPVTSDIGKTITFEVTAFATAGVLTGAPIRSQSLKIVENISPFFTSGAAVSVAEDIILTGYTATALDVDGDTLTFSLSGGTDQEALSIDSDSGVLSFNIPTRFKAPADSDGNNTYVVEITATDSIHSIVKSVMVTVTEAILEVSVSANIKTVRFEWPAYVDATSYKLFVNPDAASGFSLLQDSFPETSITITLPVHLTDWINARYSLEAYDASGNKLTESSPVSIRAVMLSSIGYFKASHAGTTDKFGDAVSLSADGNTLAVGTRWEDSSATGVCLGSNCSGGIDNTAKNSGAVYVFSRNDGIWSQQAYVKASNTGTGDEFGSAVSLSADGKTLAVGARFEDSTATGVSTDGSGEGNNTAGSSGAVYVFSRNGGVWEQQAYVKASNTGAGDGFGGTVSLSADGNTLVAGASGEDSAATGVSTDGSGEDNNTAGSSGAVYVFSRNGGTWSQQAYVKASNTGTVDLFGSAVSLSGDGNTLAVGTTREESAATGISTDGSGEDDNTASRAGAVYVFSRNDGTWSQQAYVKARNTEADDLFGHAVSLSGDGNTLAVGAIQEDSAAIGISTDGSGEDNNQASFAGAVYVFSRSDGTWSQQAYVKASNTGEYDWFGSAVSLSADGNTLAVGASLEGSAATGVSTDGSGEGDNGQFYFGAVYVFSRNGGTWSQQAYVKASNTGRYDQFGNAVSLSADGNTLAVGASLEDSAATGIGTGGSTNNSAQNAGAVYLY